MAKAISIDPNGKVVPSDRVVKIKKSEDVRWNAEGDGGPWIIAFDKDAKGSPFSEDAYVIDKGSRKETKGGAVKGKEGLTYSYNVKNVKCETTDDPDIEIEG